MSKDTLWPRFLCKRDEAGKITEERQFASADVVPKGEGWELITPPEAPAAATAAVDSAALKEAQALNEKLAGQVAELQALKPVAAATALKAELKAAGETIATQAARIAELEAAQKPADAA